MKLKKWVSSFIVGIVIFVFTIFNISSVREELSNLLCDLQGETDILIIENVIINNIAYYVHKIIDVSCFVGKMIPLQTRKTDDTNDRLPVSSNSETKERMLFIHFIFVTSLSIFIVILSQIFLGLIFLKLLWKDRLWFYTLILFLILPIISVRFCYYKPRSTIEKLFL
ncbi:MAG: hypothetical protein QXI58_05490 [Candidatus Micrarchaeia archaeon]